MQLKIDSNTNMVFEWIPYSQFSHIKGIGEGGFAIVYSAKWNNSPKNKNKKVALKCLYNSQNADEFLNEV